MEDYLFVELANCIVDPLWESALLSDTQESLLGRLYTGGIGIHLDAIGWFGPHLKISLFALFIDF